MRKHIQMFVVCMLSMNVLWAASPTYGGTDFTGPYELQNWSAVASNGGTTSIIPSSGPATSAAFGYNIDLRDPATGRGGGVTSRTWTFSATAANTGTVTFDWQYDFYHAWFHVAAVFRTYAVTSSGTITTTELNFYNDDDTGSQSRNGTVTIDVEEGLPFGFIVGGSNYDWDSRLSGTLTITNFEYSDPEPEPIQDISEEPIDAVVTSGPYRWNSAYDISYSQDQDDEIYGFDGAVTVNLNIRLIGDDPGDDLKNIWESGIEDIWSNKYAISDDMFRYSIIFDVNWVQTNFHHTVTVHSGSPDVANNEWEYMLDWYTDLTSMGWSNDFQDAMVAHEAGHMFGLYDEYAGGALNPEGLTAEYSIMADLARLTYDRHYEGILAWLAGESGRDLDLVSLAAPPGPGYSPPRVDNFQDPMPLVSEPPIPEPSTFVLVLLGLLTGIILSKKHRKRM